MSYMMALFSYLKKHKILTILTVLTVLGFVYFSQKEPTQTYETTLVKKGNVLQEVSVTGRVESDSTAQLSFEKGGRISSSPIPVGTSVKRGDVLARIDSREIDALLAQSRANREFELANLSALKQGSRPEDIAVSEASVASAASAVSDARLALLDALSSASTVADDAIFSKTDYLLDNPRMANPKVLFPISDQKLTNKIEESRAGLSESLRRLTILETTTSDIESRLTAKKNFFSDIKTYLDLLASAINSVLPSSQYSQTTIDGWKTSVSIARTNINSASSAVLTGEQLYRTQSSALAVATEQLALKKAGPTTESILAQESKIASVRAGIQNLEAQESKSVLRAPFAGIVTSQSAKFGETVSPNVPLVTLQSLGKFKITINVPEVDLAKLSLADEARVTLDAYGSDVLFAATLSSIDPAETIIEGISTYKVTLYFNEDDVRIRSGMTANIDIGTDKRVDVLYIPSRAVITREGKKYVKIPNGPLNTLEKEITVGLRGSDGSLEVTTGLTLGESIVTFEKK